MSRSRDTSRLFWWSAAVAVALTLLPWPPAQTGMKPYWMALVLIYFSLETSDIVHMGAAFVLGLVLDLTTASLLGQHALSLVVLVFLVQRFRPRIRFFPAWQQTLVVGGLLINDKIILLWILMLRGHGLPSISYWLAPLLGMLLWPVVFLVLDRLRKQRARIPS